MRNEIKPKPPIAMKTLFNWLSSIFKQYPATAGAIILGTSTRLSATFKADKYSVLESLITTIQSFSIEIADAALDSDTNPLDSIISGSHTIPFHLRYIKHVTQQASMHRYWPVSSSRVDCSRRLFATAASTNLPDAPII